MNIALMEELRNNLMTDDDENTSVPRTDDRIKTKEDLFWFLLGVSVFFGFLMLLGTVGR